VDVPCEQFKGKADALCKTCGWGRVYHPIECRGPSAPARCACGHAWHAGHPCTADVMCVYPHYHTERCACLSATP
jgi:hypothetical protein